VRAGFFFAELGSLTERWVSNTVRFDVYGRVNENDANPFLFSRSDPLHPAEFFRFSSVNTMNVGYNAISEEQLPAWIAKETGIISKNGLIAGESPISQVGGSLGQSLVDYHRHRSQDDAVRAQENV
jgi:hypothetical protein